jgi:hypothetical protein
MMFIIRTAGARPERPGIAVKMTRRTPDLVRGGASTTDYFCAGDPGAARDQGLPVVPVHDGWYADDTGGGMAIFGQGQFWEVRDTPFTVKESDDGLADTAPRPADGIVNVRGAIFGV